MRAARMCARVRARACADASMTDTAIVLEGVPLGGYRPHHGGLVSAGMLWSVPAHKALSLYTGFTRLHLPLHGLYTGFVWALHERA